jgi:hypothetical protein
MDFDVCRSREGMMGRSRRWSLVAVLAVVASALSLAACGSGGSGAATISIGALRTAADNSQQTETQTFEFTADVDAGGRQLTMKGSGIVASDGKTGRLTMTIPPVGEVQEIITPDGVYLDMGSMLGSMLPAGKKWLFMSTTEISGKSGVDLQQLGGQDSQTSTQALEYLQATTGDVEKVGEDTVAGEPATHYVTHVDYGKFSAEHMPNATAAEKAQIAKFGVVPMDVWINGHDQVVKMEFDVDASGLGGAGSRMRMTMEITGFGAPLDVTPPPADQVITQSELGTGSAV